MFSQAFRFVDQPDDRRDRADLRRSARARSRGASSAALAEELELFAGLAARLEHRGDEVRLGILVGQMQRASPPPCGTLSSISWRARLSRGSAARARSYVRLHQAEEQDAEHHVGEHRVDERAPASRSASPRA